MEKQCLILKRKSILKPQKRKDRLSFSELCTVSNHDCRDRISLRIPWGKNILKEKVADYIERYQLNGLEKRYPAQLSGGQQQRVALATNDDRRTGSILLDEPFSALDGYLKDMLQRRCRISSRTIREI